MEYGRGAIFFFFSSDEVVEVDWERVVVVVKVLPLLVEPSATEVIVELPLFVPTFTTLVKILPPALIILVLTQVEEYKGAFTALGTVVPILSMLSVLEEFWKLA